MFQRRVIDDHDEEESIFISMTDLTVSMMLLLVILLGFFASQFRSASLFEQAEQRSEEVRALRVVAAQKDRDMRALTQSVAAVQAALLTSQAERFALQEKLLAADTATIAQAAQADEEMAAQQAENDALRSEVTALEQKVAGTESERDRAQSALAQATAEFEDSLTIALSDAAELATRLARQSEEVRALRVVADQKDRDTRALTQSVAALQAALLTSQAERFALQEKLLAADTATIAQAAQAGEQRAAQQAENDALRSEVTALEQKVAGIESERDRAQSALAQATEEFENSLTIALSDAADLAARLQTSEALLAAERARAVAREYDLARATEALSVQQVNNLASEQLRLAHDTLEKEVFAQAAKNAALQSELQSLENLLSAAIQSTTSLLGKRAPKRQTAPVPE